MLVAGASIAGPALAHWLRRRGAEVTVVERAPELRPGGQAVDARGVTREVVRRMGLDAAVRAARTETAGAYTVDVDGNVVPFRDEARRSARLVHPAAPARRLRPAAHELPRNFRRQSGRRHLARGNGQRAGSAEPGKLRHGCTL